MALYVSISINKDTIETFGAQNITGKTTGINTYRICKYTQNDHKRVFLSGTIQHHYEDGAIELAKRYWTLLPQLTEVASDRSSNKNTL